LADLHYAAPPGEIRAARTRVCAAAVHEMRKSLRLRDWQRAQELVRRWEAEGQQIEKPKPLTVKEACNKFLMDAAARNLREPTLYKYRLLFRQLQEFASLYGYSYITNFDVDLVR